MRGALKLLAGSSGRGLRAGRVESGSPRTTCRSVLLLPALPRQGPPKSGGPMSRSADPTHSANCGWSVTRRTSAACFKSPFCPRLYGGSRGHVRAHFRRTGHAFRRRKGNGMTDVRSAFDDPGIQLCLARQDVAKAESYDRTMAMESADCREEAAKLARLFRSLAATALSVRTQKTHDAGHAAGRVGRRDRTRVPAGGSPRGSPKVCRGLSFLRTFGAGPFSHTHTGVEGRVDCEGVRIGVNSPTTGKHTTAGMDVNRYGTSVCVRDEGRRQGL